MRWGIVYLELRWNKAEVKYLKWNPDLPICKDSLHDILQFISRQMSVSVTVSRKQDTSEDGSHLLELVSEFSLATFKVKKDNKETNNT